MTDASPEFSECWQAGATDLERSGPPPFDAPSLARHLGAHGFRFDPGQPIRRFAGGLANRNYLVAVNDGLVVLRRPPDGDLPPGAHDMAREHRILSRLAPALTLAPDSLHYCDDRAVIGVPFQLLEYRPGLVLRGADLGPLAAEKSAPGRLSEMLVATLAAIHHVNAAAIGLGDLGRPEDFVARAVDGWTRRGLRVAQGSPATAATIEAVAAIEAVAVWLRRQPFGERSPTLLHGDFKLDNLILDPRTLAARAVVDWDMGTRGDPLFDLATLLSYWAEPGDPDCLTSLGQMPTSHPGFWTRAEAAERYAALTGLDLTDLPAMRVLATLKLGVIFLQLHGQWTSGAVTEPRYEGFWRTGASLIGLAHDLSRGSETLPC